jgi:hypothetical protein
MKANGGPLRPPLMTKSRIRPYCKVNGGPACPIKKRVRQRVKVDPDGIIELPGTQESEVRRARARCRPGCNEPGAPVQEEDHLPRDNVVVRRLMQCGGPAMLWQPIPLPIGTHPPLFHILSPLIARVSESKPGFVQLDS